MGYSETITAPPSAHSALGASGAERWTACPGSVPLSQGFPRKASQAAAEGTAAHLLASLELTGERPLSDPPAFIEADGFIIEVDEDMIEHVRGYCDFVNDERAGADTAYHAVEQQLDLARPLGVAPDSPLAGAFGTADAVVVRGSTLKVIDLKYGKGKAVKADGNLQLSLYALGALADPVVALTAGDSITDVELVVYQPRVYDEPQIEYLTLDELRERGAELARAAAEVSEAAVGLAAIGGRSESSAAEWDAWVDRHLRPGSTQCNWCPVKQAGKCPALEQVVDEALALAPAELHGAELGAAMEKVDLVEQWAEAVRDLVRAQLDSGLPVPGWKLVAGRAGARKWASAEEAEAALRKLRLPIDTIAPRSVISPTQTEKLVKAGEVSAAQWERLAPLITASPAKPVLVPEADKRPALGVADEFESLA